MRVAFESGHVRGDFSSGRLTVGIAAENARRGQTVWNELYFEVPRDFHTHNDAVAAALMTLVGTRYDEVEFNFPISAQCAATLQAYYGEIEISPVDAAAPPRRPGTRLGLNFTGGMDSLAVWLLLRELYGDDYAVITSDYGTSFAFEARGYGAYHRDVTCATNLRQEGYDQDGRFNFAVPLLFAEYLGLGGIVTGHGLNHTADGLADHRRSGPPAFLRGDLVVNAGGLDDIHLLRPLAAIGVAMVVMALGRERIEAALAASTPPRSLKPYTGALFFRLLHEDAGLPLPWFLANYPRPLMKARSLSEHPLRLLYLVKRLGVAEVAEISPEFGRHDLSWLDDLSLSFPTRYNPILAALLPQPLRDRAIQAYQSCGLQPYDEADWQEIAVVRRFLKQHVPRYQALDD